MSKSEDDDGCCPKCGSDNTEWEQCWNCFGEGDFDLHDEDAVNYAPGEQYETCAECNGEGGYLICYDCIAKSKISGGGIEAGQE